MDKQVIIKPKINILSICLHIFHLFSILLIRFSVTRDFHLTCRFIVQNQVCTRRFSDYPLPSLAFTSHFATPKLLLSEPPSSPSVIYPTRIPCHLALIYTWPGPHREAVGEHVCPIVQMQLPGYSFKARGRLGPQPRRDPHLLLSTLAPVWA